MTRNPYKLRTINSCCIITGNNDAYCLLNDRRFRYVLRLKFIPGTCSLCKKRMFNEEFEYSQFSKGSVFVIVVHLFLNGHLEVGSHEFIFTFILFQQQYALKKETFDRTTGTSVDCLSIQLDNPVHTIQVANKMQYQNVPMSLHS